MGSATLAILQKGNPNNKTFVHDPHLQKFYDGDRPDIAIVCTPCLSGNLDDPTFLKSIHPHHVIVRSTVNPNTFDKISHLLPGSTVSHWPEFLTMSTADRDAIFPDKVIFGTSLNSAAVPTFLNNLWGHFYRRWRDENLIVTDPETSAAIKLGINTLYSIKCAFNNLMFDIIGSQAGYNDWVEACGLDQRITVSHEQIRHNGYRGFGGRCLPKDAMTLRDCTLTAKQRRFIQELLNMNEEWLGKPIGQVLKDEWGG